MDVVAIGGDDQFKETYGISYKSFCFPFDPESADEISQCESSVNRSKTDGLWKSEPEYPAGIPAGDVSSVFGTGGYLVRNDGDRVDLNADTFLGKFVFVCCFHAPIADELHESIELCDELCSTRDAAVVVMVAWMNSLVEAVDRREVFDHFFSAFHESCLAVPCEDSEKRAYVCKLVTDYNSDTLKYRPQGIVLDAKGRVLRRFVPDSIKYGAEAFPFTRKALDDFKAKEMRLTEATSLEQLLRVNRYSPGVVYRFNPEDGPREKVSISELSTKLVGLYIPGRKGDLFPRLVDIYEQCVEKQLEFEVVVVYVDELLLKKDICRRWWWLPFEDSVMKRLHRVTRFDHKSDKLCVVGANGGFVDMAAAGVVMGMYGIDGYPFTSDSVVQKDIMKMRELTLDSVLLGDDVFRGNDPGDVISSYKLSGKKICVYFGCLYYMWDYEKVLSSYREMKAKDPGSEVVFVFVKSDLDGVEIYTKTIYAMPWYVCPINLARLKSAREIFDFKGHAIVGFGEDGRLRSFRSAKSATFTLDDTLYEDVSKRRTDLPRPKDSWYDY